MHAWCFLAGCSKYIIWITYLVTLCAGSEYWVRQNSTVDCPAAVLNERCVTIFDMARNNSKYFVSNTIINFLSGVHIINADNGTATAGVWIGTIDSVFTGQRTTNITLIGSQSGNTVIHCNSTQVGFSFLNVVNVIISRLKIQHCGFDIMKNNGYEHMSEHYLVPSTIAYATLLIVNASHVMIQGVDILNSTGIGLLALEMRDEFIVERCNFQGNCDNSIVNAPGGNAYIEMAYKECSLTIQESRFSDTLATKEISLNRGEHEVVKGNFSNKIVQQIKSLTENSLRKGYHSLKLSDQRSAGLTIDAGGANVTIINCRFINNTAQSGAHLLLGISESPSITVKNCSFLRGTSLRNRGGVCITYIGKIKPVHYLTNNIQRLNLSINLTDSLFKNQFGGAICVEFKQDGPNLDHNSKVRLVMQNIVFTDNIATRGAALQLSIRSVFPYANISVVDCQFNRNAALNYGGAIFWWTETTKTYSGNFTILSSNFSTNIADSGSAVSLTSTHSHQKGMPVYIHNCIFNNHSTSANDDTGVVIQVTTTRLFLSESKISDNICRGIYLIHESTLQICGNVWITRNQAKAGAGIFFDCLPVKCSTSTDVSQLKLEKYAQLYINDNIASDYGGGMIVKTGPQMCFFQVADTDLKSLGKIHMSGNSAAIAGTAIYGGDLDQCFLRATKETLRAELFWTIFNITERYTAPSLLASQPYKVCFCNISIRHNCVSQFSVKVFPGQAFQVQVIGVGQYNYSSPSVIRVVVPPGVEVGKQQVAQEVKTYCTSLLYTLQTLEKSIAFELFVETPFSLISYLPAAEPATVVATILDCPLGFHLQKKSQTCDCLPQLIRKGVTCDIDTQTVGRSNSLWIGNYSNNVVAHNNCPFDYCNQSTMSFRLSNQDDQCNWNRSGLLCGACKDGFSIMLGTSKCQKCSNTYLLLLIPILLAGFGLVIFLLKCNFTVSVGTINGLIFYANIIQVNKNIFFSSHPPGIMSTLSYVLSLLIAWINLDLGIEVCFANNLGTFGHTWLQFLFPIYIWCIIGLLIIVCRYSTTVSRLAGSNTVSVLATLFLLSYTKLLRTTLNAFSLLVITDPNDTAHLRWLLDANYGYLQWPHLGLFLVALFTLVFHLIPFTVLLLLGPALQAHTNYRALAWVNKIKPFLDAYHGPYKTKYRYWTGLMLFVRVFLMTVFAANALGDPKINLLTIMITTLVLLIVWIKVGRIYRKSPVNVLELVYLINIEIFAMITFYLKNGSNTEGQQQILSLIAVGSAFVVFIIVLICHCYTKLVQTKIVRKLHKRVKRNIQLQNVQPEEPQMKARSMSPTRTEINLRELLLAEQ